MKRAFVLVALASLFVVSGCGSKPGGVSKGDSTSGAADSPVLIGKYQGDIEAPKTGTEDVGSKMAEAMGDMFAGLMRLEIVDDKNFKLTMMGIPVEGDYVVDGPQITLTSRTVMGMTPEEAAKKQKDSNGQMNIDSFKKPIVGTISADRKTIRLADKAKPEEGVMVFVFEEPRVAGKATVSEAERPWVGTFAIDMDAIKVEDVPKEEAPNFEEQKAMLKGSTLTLLEDNSFVMELVMKTEGTWALKDDKVILTPAKSKGEGGATMTTEPFTFLPQSDGASLQIAPKPGTPKVFFRRKG